jgi:hypothetical protein
VILPAELRVVVSATNVFPVEIVPVELKKMGNPSLDCGVAAAMVTEPPLPPCDPPPVVIAPTLIDLAEDPPAPIIVTEPPALVPAPVAEIVVPPSDMSPVPEPGYAASRMSPPLPVTPLALMLDPAASEMLPPEALAAPLRTALVAAVPGTVEVVLPAPLTAAPATKVIALPLTPSFAVRVTAELDVMSPEARIAKA